MTIKVKTIKHKMKELTILARRRNTPEATKKVMMDIIQRRDEGPRWLVEKSKLSCINKITTVKILEKKVVMAKQRMKKMEKRQGRKAEGPSRVDHKQREICQRSKK